MLLEAVAAAAVGVAVLLLVLQPLLRSGAAAFPAPEPLDPEETPRGIALTALKEIDFDRETGKLSEEDYRFLKAKYTGEALEALRTEPIEALIAARLGVTRSTGSATTPCCPTCGPRPEPDAVFCSTCGLRLRNHPEGSESARLEIHHEATKDAKATEIV